MERLTYNFPYFNGKSCWHVVGTSVETCAETCARMGREGCDICPICKAIDRLAEYENAEESGLLVRLPCKVGDTVWAIRNIRGVKMPMPGVVAEMYFTQDMRLIVRVHGVKRGEVGKSVFLSLEDAEAALKKG